MAVASVREKWTELRQVLSAVLIEIKPQLDCGNAELIADFIENNEFGVAYEWINSVVSECKLDLSRQALEGLQQAARLMRIDA